MTLPKFFTVLFLKDDGTTRRMECRTDVKKGIKGTGKPCSDPNVVRVWEVLRDAKGRFCGGQFRSFRIERVIELRACGVVLIAEQRMAA